jgi:YVTN family beta-propeller protein
MKLCALIRHGRWLAPAAAICLTAQAFGGRAAPNAPTGQQPVFDDWVAAKELIPPAWANKGENRDIPTTFISSGEDPECDMPTQVVFTPDGQRMLITHEGSMNVGVYDTDTREILNVIPLTDHPYDIGVMPDGVTAITANLWDNTASFVDYINGVEQDVVPVGAYPSMVLVSPDGSYAAIGNALDETWSIIDTATRQVIHTVSAGGAFGFGFAGGQGGTYSWTYKSVVLPDNRLVLADWNNLQVNFVTLATGAIESVTVNPSGMFLTATPDGSRVVVVHNPVPDPCSLTIINTATMAIDGTITAPYQSLYNNAVRPVMRPDGTRVAFWSGPTAVMIFDITDYNSTPIQSYTFGDGFIGTYDGQYLFLNRSKCSSLLEWETGQPLYFDGAPEFCAPDDMHIISSNLVASSPVENRIAMISVLEWQEDVTVFNVDGLNAHAEACVKTGPDVEADFCLNMDITSDGGIAVGINAITENATIFDLNADEVIGWASIGKGSRGVVITPDDTRALVTNVDSGTVTVIDLATLATTDVTVDGCSGPVVIDEAGQWAYIAGIIDNAGLLYRLDLATLQLDPIVLDTAPAGSFYYRTIGLFLDMTWARPYELIISHDGTTMCVCGGGAFSVIDLADWAEDARLPLSGSIPEALAAVFSLDDLQIYLSHMDVYDGDTTYLHTVTNDGENSAIVDTISIGKKGFMLEMNGAGDKLYVGCRGFSTDESRKVAVVDLINFAVEADIPLPDLDDTTFQRPVGIQLSGDESVLYAVTSDGYAHLIDTATNAVTESHYIGAYSGCRFLLNDNGRGYVVSPHPHMDGITALDLEIAPCPADVNNDGVVNIDDLFDVLGHWGQGAGQWDVNDDGKVDIDDVFAILGDWGPC